ncbi:hypothetical protein R6Q57_026152 [Mikania cordata]
MAQSTSSVGQASNAEATVVRILTHSRNMEIWCNWDLVEMSDGSQKARCKFCGMLLAKESNTSLKKYITKPFCKALKNDPESQQTQISNDGGIFHYNIQKKNLTEPGLNPVGVPGSGPDWTLPGSRSGILKPVRVHLKTGSTEPGPF